MLSRFSALLRCDLAIDLGSACARVAVPGEGLVVEEPAVVAAAAAENRILTGSVAVGHLARQMEGRAPESVRVARPLAGGAIIDPDLCQALLRWLMHKARPARYGRRPRVLLAIAGGLTAVEKRAVVACAQRAGAGQVLLLNSAHAAALGTQLPVAEPLASMVIDLGAGKTEVAVLSLGDVVARRSVRVGGDALDAALVAHLHRAHHLRVGLATAEELRIEMGAAVFGERIRAGSVSDEEKNYFVANASGSEWCTVRGVDANSGLPLSVKLSAHEIAAALAVPLAEILEAVRGTLDGCSPDLVADVVERGAVLCGGLAQTPGWGEWLSARAGIPTVVAADPTNAVVTGTLACLEHLPTWRSLVEGANAAV